MLWNWAYNASIVLKYQDIPYNPQNYASIFYKSLDYDRFMNISAGE